MAENFWFDINKIRSYNRVLNFVVGARGIGKTFGFKEWAVADWLENKNQFIYMRRFEKELINRKAKEGFFPVDLKKKYPEHEFKFSDGAYMIDGEVAGYPMVLSKAGQEKGIIEYDNVTKVLFDEFIIDKRNYHYLPDETTIFKEAMITIARLRFVQFFLMANATTWNNPYFVKYGIQRPADNSEFIKTKSYVLQMPVQNEYKKVAEQSPIGKVLKDLDKSYFEYAYDNKLYRDNADFIEKKTPKAIHRFTVTYSGVKIGVWYDFGTGLVYCSRKFDEHALFNYVLSSDEHTTNTILVGGRKSVLIKSFVEAFERGSVRFEDSQVKNIVYDIMKILM